MTRNENEDLALGQVFHTIVERICNNAVGHRNCEQLFSRILTCMMKRKVSTDVDMI